jgi:hypothetical protein
MHGTAFLCLGSNYYLISVATIMVTIYQSTFENFVFPQDEFVS